MRSLMERSSRFLSLSGLSGVWAGLCALAGAAAVYIYLDVLPLSRSALYFEIATRTQKWGMGYKSVFVLIALMVLVSALAGGIFFTTRKARRQGLKIWDATSRRLLWAVAVPLTAGGIFGLALVNGSKYTLRDVEFLGLSEIALGSAGLFYPGSGLELWTIGFGLLHIFYGAWMYWRYER